MARSKHLVITSDDFGMCQAVNVGIVRGLTEGVLTATTLMAPCPWFVDAVHLAKKHGLKAGVHLTLTCEWDRMRWGPITRAPGLMATDGGLHSDIPDVVKSATDDEILAEYDAQIARVRAAGIVPTHIDHHMLGGEDPRPGVARIIELRRRTCEKHGLVYPRAVEPGKGLLHFDGQSETSARSEREIWDLVESWNKPGFYHLFAHAAVATPELEGLCSDDHPARNWAAPVRISDFDFLIRPSTRARLEKLGFELIDMPRYFALKKAA